MPWTRRIEGWRELESAGRPGPALRSLMLGLGVVYLLQAPLGLEAWAALQPEAVLGQGKLWQLLTYAVLHLNLLHLLFNLLGFWVFGSELEKLWGQGDFLLFVAGCAVAAGLSHAMLDPLLSGRPSMVMGASGAVYGLMAAYGLIYRQRRLYLWGLLPIRADVLALAFGAFALVSGVTQSQDGTPHVAHLGGMLGGVLLLSLNDIRSWYRSWRHRQRMLRHLRRASGQAGSQAFPQLGAMADEVRVRARLDEVLDKVSRLGMASLSAEERRFLDSASAWLRERNGRRA